MTALEDTDKGDNLIGEVYGPSDSKTTRQLDTKILNANLQEPSLPSQPSLQGIVQSIYRIGNTDRWACRNCKQRDDIWFMQKHLCSGRR